MQVQRKPVEHNWTYSLLHIIKYLYSSSFKHSLIFVAISSDEINLHSCFLIGRKAFETYVGEPFRPTSSGSNKISLCERTFISVFFARFIPLIVGREGSYAPCSTQ